MDSLRTIHARVAALTRFRPPDDAELAAAREELARCLEQTRDLRARVSHIPPGICEQFLPPVERAPASV